MAARKKSDTDDKDTSASGDLQEKVDKINEQGYFGTKVDPHDNADYTLTTGPDSPPYPDEPRNVHPVVNGDGEVVVPEA